MVLKAGIFVRHSVAQEWGAGKVITVTPSMATIDFSDGISRKIAASHFHTLQPAEASAFSPPSATEQLKRAKKRATTRAPKKK
jgi:transcription elongation factor GreA-like protein